MISQNTQNLLEVLPDFIDYSKTENKDNVKRLINTYKKTIQIKKKSSQITKYKKASLVLKELQDYVQDELTKQEVKLLRRIVEDIDYSQKRAVELDAELNRIVSYAKENSTLVPLINDIKDHLKIIF